MSAPLTIRLLGGFEVLVHGERIRPLRSRKGEWLVGWLVLQAGRPAQRDRLVSGLWPDSESLEGGLDSLRKTLYDLRQALGSEASRVMSRAPRALVLELTGADVDVWRFDSLVHHAGGTSMERLAEAVTIYCGPLLPGCTAAWIVEECAKRETSYLHALDILAAYCLDRKDYSGAIGYLQRAVTAAPTHDRPHRKLISVLAQIGDQAAAIQVYQSFRQRLRRELNAEPAAETTALYRRLRQAEHDPAQARPARSLFATDIGPANPLRETEVPTFIGRSSEVQDVLRLIRVSGQRLLTITGLGGLGKTRLAQQLAEELAPDFSEGVCLIECAGLRSRSDLVGRACAQLGLVPAKADAENTLQMFLKTTRKLMILDGVESIAEAAPFVEGLVTAASHLGCLVTSRIALGTLTETEYALGPLTYGSMGTAAPDDSVQLFLSAATQAVPAYRPTITDLRIISRICTALEGFPLSLVLAAAWLRYLTLGDLLRQVEQRRLSVLTDPTRAPHTDLAGIVFASVDLLPPAERRTLFQLSVIAGSFFLEDAAKVCGEDTPFQLLPHLRRLKDHGLLQITALGDRTRFLVLDTVRDCLDANLRQTDAADLPLARRRHATYYVRHGKATRKLIQDGHWKDAMSMLWREIGNLRAVVRYATEERQPGIIADLTEAIGRTYLETGLLDDFEELMAAATAAAEELPSVLLKARVLGLRGALARRRGHEQLARECWEARLAIYQTENDTNGSMDATFDLAGQSVAVGDLASAKRQLAGVLRLAHRHRLGAVVVSCLTMAAQISVTEGRQGRTRRRAGAALRKLTSVLPIDQATYPCYHWIMLGRVFRQLGDHHTAISLLVHAVHDGYRADRINDVGYAVMELGVVYEHQHQCAFAALSYAAAWQIHTELGSVLEGQTQATVDRYVREYAAELQPVASEIRTLPWREIVPRLLQANAPLHHIPE